MSEQQGHEQQDPKQGPPPGYQQPGPQPGYPPPGQPGPHQQGYPPPGFPPPGYYPPPGTYTGDPNAPYGYDPYGRPYSDKSKVIAGILQLTLGGFGVGRFYLGNVGMGLAQLFTCGGLGVWSLIDGILLLTGNDHTDEHGRILRS
ncbi:TM2 domain-containing protein [Streptomyces sp. NRRL B-24085]|uniref:TM2 domain-containing protein n=1 Tax=Streptomyces sp. NRRL B-24085 TaxID=1709476 RepID=UPI0006B3B245|nr:TM2 domain-containing protein [Streptomyces sp. NRRL B-24085]